MSREATQIRTGQEAVNFGREGGKKSGEARRRKRELRQYMEALLAVEKDNVDGMEALALALFEKALSGDTRAIEIVIGLLGQRPKQTVNFKLPKLQSVQDVAKAAAAILAAACNGKITPEEGVRLGSICLTYMKAVETGELEQRIANLENIGSAKHEFDPAHIKA